MRINKLLTFACLVSFVGLQAAANEATPTLVLRSQGRHADRQKVVGMTRQTHQSSIDGNYAVTDIAFGYAQSFRNDRLARCLFGTDLDCSCEPTILIEGSNAVNANLLQERNPKAWLADYLYLNCDFVGNFKLDPKIQNITVDLDLYVGLNDWMEGLYGRVYGPITWTKWQTGFCSQSDTDVTNSCQFGGTGYFTPDGSETLLSKVSDYFAGKSPEPAGGVTFQPLKFAKMPNCDQTQAGFADLRAELGYEFFREEDYNVSVNIQAAAPTGNRRRAEFVMDPVVGNGNHWELGGGLTANYIFWRSQDEDRNFGLYVDANFTHLFKANEQRTFDLKGKVNSRYMLASRFTRAANTGGLGGVPAEGNAANPLNPATLANYVFDYAYAPVANISTLNVDVSVGVQADIVAMFSYQTGKFNFDFGYNFWSRSCENIHCPTSCNPCDESLCSLNGENRWALKGDARMFGYTGATSTAVPLSATQSAADIHSGTNVAADNDTLANARIRNGGVDNPLFAVSNTTLLIHTPTDQGGAAVATQQIQTSIQPVLLSCQDIDLQQTKGISNTIFANLSYTWDCDDYSTFLGIGGSAEFGKAASCCGDANGTNNNCCEENVCKNCVSCALSQWTVWLKGGMNFN